MKELLSYTQEELVYLALMNQFKIGALERVLVGVISSIPALVTRLETPVTPDSGQLIANDLLKKVPHLFQKEFLDLLDKDKEVPEKLKMQLRESFGDTIG